MILQFKILPGLISEKSVLSSLWTGHSFFAGLLGCNPNENCRGYITSLFAGFQAASISN
jgi:hypothetical protein